MLSLAVLVVLLAAVASFGSWQLAQLTALRRLPRAAILLCGTCFTVATVVLGMSTTMSWWRPLLQIEDLSAPLLEPVRAGGDVIAAVAERSSDSTAEVDVEKRVHAPALEDWPATECIATMRDDSGGAERRFIDNGCDRVGAVVFAWCGHSQAACDPSVRTSREWRYEPAGIVMTSTLQRPSPLRLRGEGSPLIAPTYLVDESGAQRGTVRYVACYVTSTEVLDLLGAAGSTGRDRLQSALSKDDCYSRVTRLSRAGRVEGRSPDALLHDGV
jgi:hypothetical protein